MALTQFIWDQPNKMVLSTSNTLDLLINGTPKQRRAYAVLLCHNVFTTLRSFSPVLVGTIPLNVDTAESDLDILCCWSDEQLFIEAINISFSTFPNFSLEQKLLGDHRTVIARFALDEFPVEIFGQDRPVEAQEGYRHLVIEHAILLHKGDAFRQAVVQLKQRGIKTEPAFAKLLGLPGDPYEALLLYQVPT